MGYSNLHELVVFILSTLSIRQDYEPYLGGHCWKFFLPNGYMMSIIKHQRSYGHQVNLWELAVFRHQDGRILGMCSNPVIDTDTGDDVVGFLTEKELVALAHKISDLEGPNVKSVVPTSLG